MLGYYQSSLVVEFIVGRFGIESMRGILNDLASAVPLEKAFETHTLPLSKLNSEFRKFARKQAEAYGPVSIGHPSPIRNIRNIAKTPRSGFQRIPSATPPP